MLNVFKDNPPGKTFIVDVATMILGVGVVGVVVGERVGKAKIEMARSFRLLHSDPAYKIRVPPNNYKDRYLACKVFGPQYSPGCTIIATSPRFHHISMFVYGCCYQRSWP